MVRLAGLPLAILSVSAVAGDEANLRSRVDFIVPDAIDSEHEERGCKNETEKGSNLVGLWE
jgi:hypothetical protein